MHTHTHIHYTRTLIYPYPYPLSPYTDPQVIYSTLFTLPTLSAQQLVDCDHEGDSGCSGGNLVRALDYVLDHGLVSESVYGYTGKVCIWCIRYGV
ncbi:hypothetical protein EON63_10060 [archaeon]|nr:MAG: hypothetical protein EON63_10060 [archaeon]